MAHRRATTAANGNVDREKIQSIIGVVMQSLDQPHVLFSGFNALTFFCEKATPPQQQQIVREGGVHVMLATMWTNFNNGDLMSLVCNCLWCLSVGQDGIKSMIAKEGGIPAILVALRSHPSNADLVRSPWVAESGIQSLSVALRRERPDDLLSCSKLKIPGARELNIRSILTVMSTVHDPIVIQLACDALWILALSRANVAVITRLDGIQAIADQMQSYPAHVDMLKSACGALWNVSENSDANSNRTATGGSRFFVSTRVVIEAMSAHPGHPELQKNALSYLRNAAADPAARTVLEKDNAIGVLLSVLRVFRSDPEFNEIALDVLLCLDYSNLRSLVYDGLLAAVAPLFKLYQDAFEIVRRACMLVSLLLSHAAPGIISSKSWLLLTQPHGLARTLLRLSRRMGLGSAVLSAVCGALSALSQLIVKEAKSDGHGTVKPDEVVRVASGLLREDDVRCLCETMRHNRNNLSLLTTVARIFHNLIVLQPSSGCGKYLSAGAEAVLCETMGAHPLELELHSLSVVAIGVLLGARRTGKSRGGEGGRNQPVLLAELCNSLKRFAADPKHTSRCLRGLAHCAAGPDQIEMALEVLLEVMGQYITSPAQVRDAATVVQSFLMDATIACCSPQTEALVGSLVALLCTALERPVAPPPTGHAEARIAVCQALAAASANPWTAAAGEVPKLVPTVLQLFQTSGGELVTHKPLPTTEMVLACQVLHHLADGSEERVQQIMQHSGFEIIFSATQQHKENVELLKTALEVLSLLRTATPGRDERQDGGKLTIKEIPEQPSELIESSSDDDDDEEDDDEPEPDELTVPSPANKQRTLPEMSISAPVVSGAPHEGHTDVLKPSSPPVSKLSQCIEGFPAAPDDALEGSSSEASSSDPPEPFYQSDKTLVSEMILHDLERLTSEQRGVLVYDCFEELTAADRGVGPDKLKFESHFESGNLRRAVWVGDNEYDLMLKLDVNTKGNTQWYYFTVSGQQPGVKYKFNMINLLKPDSQYNYGMQPLMMSEKAKAGWKRTGDNICYYSNHHGSKKKGDHKFFTLTFRVEFPHSEDRCHLAYCYPYTFTRLQRYLDKLQTVNPAHIRRRSLCQTLGGFSCDLLTITDFDCSPDEMRSRRGVVLTARVHPGESNASWIMQGILDYLCSSCANAKLLRDLFVFKIVPMLNPDGVIHGNYRCSLAGVDLNRRWAKPSKKLNPSIYYTKQMIRKLQETREVFVFCDIHGHSRKKNAFMYGCEPKHQPKHQQQQFQECILPKMLSEKAEIFSYDDCSFVVPKSKESTARVVVARELGIFFSYTLEASFCGASFGKHQEAHFTPQHFEKLGEAFCETLCDLNEPQKMNTALQDLQAERRRKENSRDDGDGDSDWEQNGEHPPPAETVKKHKTKKKSKDSKDKERKTSEKKDGKKGKKLGKIKKLHGEDGGNALTSRVRRSAGGSLHSSGLKRQVSAPNPNPSSSTLPLPSHSVQEPSDWHSRRRSAECPSRPLKSRNARLKSNSTTVIQVKVGTRNKDR